MTVEVSPTPRGSKILFLTWLLSGAAIATTLLWVWPFPVEIQLMCLFVAFAFLTLMKAGYYKPVRPIAFLLGSLLPYAVTYAWLGTLGNEVR